MTKLFPATEKEETRKRLRVQLQFLRLHLSLARDG